MKLVNLTPHKVVVLNPDEAYGPLAEIEPSGTVARAATTSELVGEINGIPVHATQFGEVSGLPEPEDGVIYIVSMVVGQAARERIDIVSPDSGPTALRYKEGPNKGQIIGVFGFVRYY